MPWRLAARTADAGLELGKTLIDYQVLMWGAIGAETGAWSFDWDPISKVGKAADAGATSSDVALGMVTGIIDHVQDAVERARHGDYSGLMDTALDAAFMVDGGITAIELAVTKAPALVARANQLVKSARAVAKKAPAAVADNVEAALNAVTAALPRAVRDQVPLGAGAHGGGIDLAAIGAGKTEPGALGRAANAYFATKLENAKARALGSIKRRGGAEVGKRDVAAEWVQRVETAFGNRRHHLTQFFNNLDINVIDAGAFIKSAENLLGHARIGAEHRPALLSRAVGGKVADPIKFLDNARAVADRAISNEARGMLLERAGKGQVDLEWLQQTKLTDLELDQLGVHHYTPWENFQTLAGQAAAGAPLDVNKYVSANIQVRGVAAEMVATKLELPPGRKLRHGTTEADGLQPDFAMYEIVDEKGVVRGDLEIKGARPEAWPQMLKDGLSGTYNEKEGVGRMLKQLKASRARGREVHLAVTDGMSTRSRTELARLLTKEGIEAKIWLLPESMILETAATLRQHVGIPQPVPPRKP